MELVYLWVEKYKNIENQGFNFSGQYRCHYDKDKNELSIDENKEYVHIFPNNINITAIVGKNGSGKSSIAKIILMLIFYAKYSNVTPENLYEKERSFVLNRIMKQYKDSLFLLVRQNERFKKIAIGDKFDTFNYEDIENIDFFSTHFNYMLDTLYDGPQDEWVKNVYHRNDGYETPLLLEPFKNADNEEKIDLKSIEYLNNQRMLSFYSTIAKNENITSFFNPDRLKLNIAYVEGLNLEWEQKEDGKTGFNYYFFEDTKTLKLVDKFLRLQRQFNIKISNDFKKNVIEQIKSLYEKKEYLNLNKLYIALKLLSSRKNLFSEQTYNQIKTNFLSRNHKYNKQTYINALINFELSGLLHDNNTYEVAKIEKCIEFEKKYNETSSFKLEFDTAVCDQSTTKYAEDKTSLIVDVQNIMKFIPPWVEVEFFEIDKSIKSLCSGEKGFLSFLINVLYQLSNLKDKKQYETVNIFLDETDIGFHPEWQRKYVKDILFALQAIMEKEKNINLIFLTHSPFILSDIPSQNTIFLDRDNDGNCKVLDGLKDKKQTFGANIHTLLSDAFFMENGLMGEFAKNQITKILRFLNNENKFIDIPIKSIKPIIEMIGEEFLRNKLVNLYYKKFTNDEKERKKKTLKQQIHTLQKQYDELNI